MRTKTLILACVLLCATSARGQSLPMFTSPLIPVSVMLGQQGAVVVVPAVATLRYDQGNCTVTNAGVTQPSLQNNACSGGGTPAWITDRNVNYCLYSLLNGNINWTASVAATTPTTGTTPTGQSWSAPGLYSITGRFNIQNFKMIAQSATNANVYISCGF